MSHLTCKTHKRRIIVLGSKVEHRNGDQSQCNTKTLVMNGAYIPVDALRGK